MVTPLFDPQRDVREFMLKLGYNLPASPRFLTDDEALLRCRLMMEELTEFMTAVYASDQVGTVDALIDLMYFVVGTLLLVGVPLEAAWDIVHEANMTKEPGDTDRGRDGLKGEQWVGPEARLRELIKAERERL